MKNLNNRIKIAIQKSGRLSSESLQMLTNAGISIKQKKQELYCKCDNFPLDILLVRDDDIPDLVARGICDFGIVGKNVYQEKQLDKSENSCAVISNLGFGKCRLVIAVPDDFPYQNLASLQQCRIATSYPRIFAKFLQKNNLDIAYTTLTGSVEIAPRLGLADGICDLVSTGATLKANQLREVETILDSEAILIQSTNKLSFQKNQIAQQFLNNCFGGESC